jgi:signal recognition particle receptor subunit beta
MPVWRCKHKPWLTRANTPAKARTNVKDRVAVRPVTMAARQRTPAKAREVALAKGKLRVVELKLWLFGLPGNQN